jgi:hypothetical protein
MDDLEARYELFRGRVRQGQEMRRKTRRLRREVEAHSSHVCDRIRELMERVQRRPRAG